jgi:replicative DNA helicase
MTLRCSEIAEAAGLIPSKQAGDEEYYLCPNHEDHTPSLQINDKKNCFICGPCGKSGNSWEFAAFLAKLDATDKKGIADWLRRKGLSDHHHSSERSGKAGKTFNWKQIWENAVPVNDESANPIRRYLNNRGLRPENLPPSLRCHPGLEYWEQNAEGAWIKIGEYPALIALVNDEAGNPVGILRIYLSAEGTKASVSNLKKALGSISGGGILLGERGKIMHVAEGVETSLAVRQSINQSVTSTVSAPGMQALKIPSFSKELHIWSDKDPNEAGMNAALELAKRVAKEGVKVFIHIPPGPIPEGQKSLDWLDILNAKGADALIADLDKTEPWKSSESTGWDRPVPFRQYNLPIFPIETFPNWLRDFVQAVAVATQTPVDMAAMLAITILALACAKKVIVRVKSGYEEPLNIYTVTSLPPGNRKSTVFAEMIRPVKDFEEAECIRLTPEISASLTQHKILESRLTEKQNSAARAKEPGDRASFEQEAIALSKELAEFVIPASLRLLADDTTPERLSTLLREQGGRMAVMSPEGDVFELMAGRYSKNGAPNFVVYLKGHSGDDLRVDRTGRPSEYVKNPALTVGFTVQPEVIRGLSQKEGFRGRGLLARFLYSIPESLVGHRDPNPPSVPDSVRALYYKNVRALLELSSKNDEFGQPTTHILTFSLSATVSLHSFASELEPKLLPLGELGSMADWGGKLVGAVVRIAGLFHIAGHAGESAPWEVPISSETVGRALSIGRYLIPHARAAYAEMGADPAIADAQHILSCIKRKEQSVITKRDIFEGTKGRFKRVNELEKPLSILIEHGYIGQQSTEDHHGPGRSPSPVFEVNPHLFADSANTANSANLENGGLKSLLEDYLSENNNTAYQNPGLREDKDLESGSHNSHNSQNWNAAKDMGESDLDEVEEGII